MNCNVRKNYFLKLSVIASIIFIARSLPAQTPAEATYPGGCPTCSVPSCYPAMGGQMVNYGHCGHRCQAALSYPWHCGYYYTPWGSPVALVVPPTAEKQYSMGWGVGNTRLTRIYHQFGRPYPGTTVGPGGRFRATPYWPSDTAQFGVYYVRGPW